MKFGWIYLHPITYKMFCRLRYGQHFSRRYLSLCEIVEKNSTFLDLCAGDYLLYNALKTKDIKYTAIDINPHFTRKLTRKGFNAILGDVLEIEFPVSDYVYMGASLYQFYNYEEFIIRKMQRAAKKKVIVIEPVSRFVSQKNRIMRWLVEVATKVNGNSFSHRYDYETLHSKLAYVKGFETMYKIVDGNDCMVLFKPDN